MAREVLQINMHLLNHSLQHDLSFMIDFHLLSLMRRYRAANKFTSIGGAP